MLNLLFSDLEKIPDILEGEFKQFVASCNIPIFVSITCLHKNTLESVTHTRSFNLKSYPALTYNQLNECTRSLQTCLFNLANHSDFQCFVDFTSRTYNIVFPTSIKDIHLIIIVHAENNSAFYASYLLGILKRFTNLL